MKKWIHKIKKTLLSTEGESLAESIASLFVFLVLLLAVTIMIKTSLKITSTSILDAKKMQENIVNPVILSDISNGRRYNITFSNSASGIQIHAEHKVVLRNNSGIIAFDPEVDEP